MGRRTAESSRERPSNTKKKRFNVVKRVGGVAVTEPVWSGLFLGNLWSRECFLPPHTQFLPGLVGSSALRAPQDGLCLAQITCSRGSPSVAPVLTQESLKCDVDQMHQRALNWHHLLPILEFWSRATPAPAWPLWETHPSSKTAWELECAAFSHFHIKRAKCNRCLFFLLHSGLLSLP